MRDTDPACFIDLLPDHFDAIYFTPLYNDPDYNSRRVSYRVPLQGTYVYNREYRIDGNKRKYRQSKIPLRTVSMIRDEPMK